jgi:hypothetical protein
MLVVMPVDSPASPPAPTKPRAPWARTPLHTVYGLLGPVVGGLAALYAHSGGWSPLGVLITLAVVSGVVGLVVPELIVGPHRLARATFGVLPVATTVAAFVIAAREGMADWTGTAVWVGLLAAGILGSAVGTTLQRIVFPSLARERDARWRGRTRQRDGASPRYPRTSGDRT